ncbi:MAG: M20/M25/M40 family metallo-hydrolase [bacterium]
MDIKDILLSILKIKSVTSQEEELRNFITHLIKDLIHFEVIRNNVVCYNTDNCKIAFVGHIDTVENVNEYNAVIYGDKVYGLGASDMKAGIAVMIMLLLEFYNLPILWIFYDREEGSYRDNGLELVFRNFENIIKNLDYVLIFEPTSNNVEIGCNGVINYGIWIKGKSGHSARPNTYKNPFYQLIPMIQFFKDFSGEEYSFPLEINQKIFNLRYKNNAVITQIRGYNSFEEENRFRNVVPEYCFVNLNVRFTPNYEFDEVNLKFLEFFENLEKKVIIDKIEILDGAPAGKILLNDKLKDFIKWYINVSGYSIFAKQAWTDVARFSLLGVPAINLGPGEPEQAHQKNEYARLSKTEELYNNLRRFLSIYF